MQRCVNTTVEYLVKANVTVKSHAFKHCKRTDSPRPLPPTVRAKKPTGGSVYKTELEAWLEIRKAFKAKAAGKDHDLAKHGMCWAVGRLASDKWHVNKPGQNSERYLAMTRRLKALRPEGKGDGMWWPCTKEGARQRVKWIDALLLLLDSEGDR